MLADLVRSEDRADPDRSAGVNSDADHGESRLGSGGLGWPKARPRSRRREGSEWWSDGVMFTCLPDCGRCCDEPDGLVHLSRRDAERLAKHHSLPLEEWLDRDCRKLHDGRWVLLSKPEDRTCIYILEDKSCEVHIAKPAQCRAYPFWGENMREDSAWRRTKQTCPGLDHPEAILIDGKTIRAHLDADAHAERGFIDR